MTSSSTSSVAVVAGRAVALRGRDIDTDRIMPARFLRAITFEGLEAHLFEDDRAAMARQGLVHPFDAAASRGAAILIVESNFGCGSSREHAPQAMVRRGIRAVVGESFAEIFRGNALMLGLACVTAAPEDIALLQALVSSDPEAEMRVDLDTMTLTAANLAAFVPLAMPDVERIALRSGSWDQAALLLDRYEDVERTAAELDY